MLCSDAWPSELRRCEHDSGRTRGPSSLRHEKMDNARKPGCLHPLLDGEGRVHFAHGRPGTRVFPFSHHQFRTELREACRSLNRQNVTLYQARHLGLGIDRALNVRHLNECKSQWRTDQTVQRYEKSARLEADYVALPRGTRELIETFAPLAEGAILGTSQGFVCTAV